MTKKKGCSELCYVEDVNDYWKCGENNWYCVACTLSIKPMLLTGSKE